MPSIGRNCLRTHHSTIHGPSPFQYWVHPVSHQIGSIITVEARLHTEIVWTTHLGIVVDPCLRSYRNFLMISIQIAKSFFSVSEMTLYKPYLLLPLLYFWPTYMYSSGMHRLAVTAVVPPRTSPACIIRAWDHSELGWLNRASFPSIQ